ncbi:cyclin-J isoform X2 [Cynoglossus semilaevis]|uniref:cyclin-J isoform X2 n=1 Tax=Cynoglossus semilaevis TaxID=244447 RepID=UPI0007DC906E|nr:cyclin-J isoform X2 [Cynoglossus semilaevis]
MELEDQWWRGQLATDIYQELKLPTYKGHSPQLNLRRYYTDLIAVISNHFRLCPTARHLAVYLLDLFMDRYDVTEQQLAVVSLSCLLLASKFEEREDRVPKLETLNSLGCISTMNLVLTKQSLLHMELLLLETFQWNLYLPTAAHFIEYCLSIAVHEGDLHDGWPLTCLEKSKIYLAKYAEYFLEVSLQDHVFLCFAPSLLAAACVSASRLVLHLSPTWPPQLQCLTGYTWENLVPCAEKLLIAHDSDVKEANKQKSQQQQQQMGFHSSGQTGTVTQYLQRSSAQFSQQANHRPSTYLNHSSSTGLQPSNNIQHPSASLDPKSNIANRAYQVNMHYSCAAPYFEK